MAYYLKVSLEAGNGDEVYQTTVFTQNYSDHAQQIKEMATLFPGVAATVGTQMVENGAEYLKSKK